MTETFISAICPIEVRIAPGKMVHVSDNPLLDIMGIYTEHEGGYRIPKGLRFVTGGDFADMQAAETFGIQMAMSWTSLVCFSMGVKASIPRIETILQQTEQGVAYKMRSYIYDAFGVEANLPLDVEILSNIQEHLVNADEPVKQKLALAIRWYTAGIGELDSVNRFLSHWIGLEAIGDVLHNKVHIADKSACTACNHPAGKDHRGRQGGIKHVISLESGDSTLASKLTHSRDRLMHGLEDIEVHRQTIVKNVAVVERALGAAILTALAPKGGHTTLDVSEPLRTVEPKPHMQLDAVLTSLTDEERTQILYFGGIKATTKIDEAKNDETGGLVLKVNAGFFFFDHFEDRITNVRISMNVPPGVEATGADQIV